MCDQELVDQVYIFFTTKYHQKVVSYFYCYMCVCMCVQVTQLCLTLCGPLGCSPSLLCPWDFPGNNTGGGCRFLLQGIFLTQGLDTHVCVCVCVCMYIFSSVQSLSCVRLFATPWTTARQASLSVTNSQSLPKLMSIESVMPSNHRILCHPLLLLLSILPSIRVFSSESALCIRWTKYWSFSFSISPSNEHLGLISFRMDWLDLLAVQGTLRSLFQHHSLKASILRH